MTNVRRKGDLLYIPYPNAVFPNRCIKTNQPIESADYVVSFLVPPWLQRGYQDSHIKMVVLYKILHDSKRVKFKIGLSSASRKRRKCFLICSYLMSGIIGTVCLVGTFNVESEIFRAFCVTGTVVSLVLWMLLPFLGWLRLVRFSEDRLVVSGAPKQFLDTLAEFYDQLLVVIILSVNYDVFPPEIL